MRVIVAGGRDFNDYELLKERLDYFLRNQTDVTIVSGGCPTGADYFGEKWAKDNGFCVDVYPADWKTHKYAAGPIRNRLMAANADALIAFWDGQSKGTKNMIHEAKKRNLMVRVVMY